MHLMVSSIIVYLPVVNPYFLIIHQRLRGNASNQQESFRKSIMKQSNPAKVPYAFQETIVGNTLPKIVDLFELDFSQIKQKLIKFRSKFEEIRNQESTLLYRLQEAITKTE